MPGHVGARPGEDHPLARLREQDVRDIRGYYSLGVSLVLLAAEFDVSVSAVQKVVRRTTWKHVTDDPEPPPALRRWTTAELDELREHLSDPLAVLPDRFPDRSRLPITVQRSKLRHQK